MPFRATALRTRRDTCEIADGTPIVPNKPRKPNPWMSFWLVCLHGIMHVVGVGEISLQVSLVQTLL